jgi:hypothetical protein
MNKDFYLFFKGKLSALKEEVLAPNQLWPYAVTGTAAACGGATSARRP